MKKLSTWPWDNIKLHIVASMITSLLFALALVILTPAITSEAIPGYDQEISAFAPHNRSQLFGYNIHKINMHPSEENTAKMTSAGSFVFGLSNGEPLLDYADRFTVITYINGKFWYYPKDRGEEFLFWRNYVVILPGIFVIVGINISLILQTRVEKKKK